MPRSPLRALLLLTACLGGAAGADTTVAPTPLYASPTLSGSPVLTLPSGKPVSVLRSPGGARRVVTIPYGERVLYARAGNVRITGQSVRLSGAQWWLPPQPGNRPVTVYLNREPNAASARVREWEVRVLPLAPAAPGESGLRVTGGAVRTLGVSGLGPRVAAGLGRLAPGSYLVTASRADAPASVLAAEVLQVTDLALTALTTPAGVWVWTTRLDDGAVLPGVRLRVAASRPLPDGEVGPPRLLPPASTDARGLAFLPQRDGERLAVYGDASLGGATQRAVLGAEYGGLWSGEEARARAFVQTDKPVYRPGETLRGLAVARRLEPGARTPYRGAVTVRLVDDGYPGVTLARRQATTDGDGLVRFEFPLPGDVRVGEYRVEVEVPGPATAANPAPEPDVSSVPVRVQAFVKPQFTLDLTAPGEVVTGDPLAVEAKAELYAGGGATVGADAYLGGGYARDTLWPGAVDTGNPNERFGLELQSWEYWRSTPGLDPGQKPAARLDLAAGKGGVTLRPTATGGVPRVYSVVVRARDEYGRDVLASREVTVHPAGLKFELPTFPERQGEEVTSRVLVRQVGSGVPLAGRPVTATVVRAYSEAVRVNGRTEFRNREEVVSRRDLRSGPQGAFDLAFRAARPGAYLVRLSARDAAGRGVRATFQAAFVPEPASLEQVPTLNLTADRPRYAVGDTARLTLRTDLPTRTPLLLSANVEGRVTPRLVRVTGREMSLSWPVTPDLAPGFTVLAVAVSGADSLRAGTELLYVPRTDRQLDVTVTPGREVLKPGEETTLTVRTRQGGRPVSALVTLAAVHEAVYALAGDPSPDPWRLLWGASYPAVQTYSTAGAPADGGGGGGGEPQGGVPRQDLREVALFRTVTTGPDGTAEVRLPLPEALGPYRITTRALTRGGGAGAARGEVRAELPFALRLARPRVLTRGDVGRAVLSVLDRTGPGGEAGQGTATLGLAVGGGEATRSLPLNRGAATASFPLVAPGTGGNVVLDAWARRGEFRDALRETLPLREAGPRTLLTRDGEGTGPLTDPLPRPGGAQVESLTVDLAATPLQAALTGLDAHLADPEDRWVTTDAVAARLGANLDLAGIAARLSWPDVRERALAQARRDLASLLALRSGEGWGWTQGSLPTAEMTARALEAVAQAKGAGLTDAATLAVAAGETRRFLNAPTTGEADRPRLAAALARAGDPSAALRLARAGGPADPADLARLAAALAPVAPDLAGPLYGRARRSARTTATGTLVLGDAASWRGDTEPTALLLGAAVALGRTADVAPLTAALLDRRTGAAWPGPLATGAALDALRRLVEREAGRRPSEVTVELGSFRQAVRVGSPVRVVVPPEAVTPAAALTLRGDGPFAFRRELRVRAEGSAPAPLSLVRVERRYDRTTAPRDGVVTVTLTLRADVAGRHLRVTDPLPGGMEAVDDRPFAFPGSVNPPRSGTVLWAERSIYDDRAVFYLERVEPGVTTIRYQLRALAPGRYTAPAPRVDFAGGGAPAVGSAQVVEVLE